MQRSRRTSGNARTTMETHDDSSQRNCLRRPGFDRCLCAGQLMGRRISRRIGHGDNAARMDRREQQASRGASATMCFAS
jgi:hypothetical protein